MSGFAQGRPAGGTHAGHEAERIMPGTELWEAQYAEHLQRYEFVAQRMPPGARVLDAGCGVGYGSAFLADRGASMVVGVDVAPEAIETARARFDRPNVTWILEDCHTLERAGAHAPFDLVCNLENLEHLSEPERFLARVSALLDPRGVLVTSTPNRAGVNRLRGMAPDAPGANPFHAAEYTPDGVRALLLRHFEQVTFAYQTLVPLERMLFEPLLAALWHNPAQRLGRWVQRVVRGRPVARRWEELLPAREYQILASDPGEALVITLLAECRGPRHARRPGAAP
jgi:SAM-dependent methyltransferase